MKCDILNLPLFWPQYVFVVQIGGACREEGCEVRNLGALVGMAVPVHPFNSAILLSAANASVVTQAAMELVTEVERAVERYCQGMGHLGRQLPLPGPPQMLLVTHRRAGAAAPEAVVQGQPSWGSTVPAPASWDAASLTSPEVPAQNSFRTFTLLLACATWGPHPI